MWVASSRLCRRLAAPLEIQLDRVAVFRAVTIWGTRAATAKLAWDSGIRLLPHQVWDAAKPTDRQMSPTCLLVPHGADSRPLRSRRTTRAVLTMHGRTRRQAICGKVYSFRWPRPASKGHGKNNSTTVLARTPGLGLVAVALLLGGPPNSRAEPDSRRRTKRSTKSCRGPKCTDVCLQSIARLHRPGLAATCGE